MTALWVVGDGGQAREILDLLRTVEHDDEIIGLLSRADEPAWLADTSADRAAVIGLGFPQLRARVLERLTAAGVEVRSLVHPGALLGAGVQHGDGVVVSAACVVTTDVRLGDGVLLNPRSGVGHDAEIGACSVLNPGASISGHVTLGPEVLVGSNATVLQGLTIGAGARIGAGAVVTHDVAPGTTVAGVPARLLEDQP